MTAMATKCFLNGDLKMPASITVKVNGKEVTEVIKENTLLVDFLRDSLRLTGTHIGCDTAQCGACTVHLDGSPIKSCNILAVQADGAKITTIEGLSTKEGNMHPMQKAFRDHHGLQCGFCTPGMIMSALGILSKSRKPTEAEIREGLEGNLCRCTGYHNIVKAINSGAEAIAKAQE